MASNYIRRWKIFSLIRKIENEVTMKYTKITNKSSSVSMATIKKTNNSMCWQRCGELEPSCVIDRN